jgi:hypothetical protein
VDVTGAFSISAEYCKTLHGNDCGDVRVLTHGLGFAAATRIVGRVGYCVPTETLVGLSPCPLHAF